MIYINDLKSHMQIVKHCIIYLYCIENFKNIFFFIGRIAMLVSALTFTIYMFPSRLPCPLNSAVVLASYAVQCK